jgi:hypothetical protein
MRAYKDIPEVWIREVNKVFSDMLGLLMRITPQHVNEKNEEFKKRALEARTELITPLVKLKEAMHCWLRDHPQELEFVFKKMRMPGFSDVREWGVTDGPQFRGMEENELLGMLVLWGLQNKNEEQKKQVTRLHAMFCQDFADVLDVLQTYKGNDVYSIDLRRQLMHLHEDIEHGKYEEATTALLSPFVLKAAYKLWGWGDFVDGNADGTTARRDAYALQMTGAPGFHADRLNGFYVETKEKQNGKSIFKKTSMLLGNQLWLRSNTQNKWIVSITKDMKENTNLGMCRTTKAGIAPVQKLWRVFNADNEEQWKEYPDLQCDKITAADLLWELPNCDVVINALPADEIQHLISKCGEICTVLASTTEENILRHLGQVEQTLQRMLTAQNAGTPIEPGECGQCMERRATEIFLPCHHVVVCSICSKKNTSCPTCRKPIDASCNLRVYMTRNSHAPKKIWDVTKPMDQDASMNSLLLQLRDLH